LYGKTETERAGFFIWVAGIEGKKRIKEVKGEVENIRVG
jgi:hypothetical protein